MVRNCRSEDGMRRNAHVVPNFVLLDFSALPLNQLFDNKAANSIAGVSLLRVGFNDDTTIHSGSVIILVFAGVVGMNSVSHVTAYKERLRN